MGKAIHTARSKKLWTSQRRFVITFGHFNLVVILFVFKLGRKLSATTSCGQSHPQSGLEPAKGEERLAGSELRSPTTTRFGSWTTRTYQNQASSGSRSSPRWHQRSSLLLWPASPVAFFYQNIMPNLRSCVQPCQIVFLCSCEEHVTHILLSVIPKKTKRDT